MFGTVAVNNAQPLTQDQCLRARCITYVIESTGKSAPGEIILSVLLRGWKYPASGSHQLRYFINLTDNLAIRRDKTGQSLRRPLIQITLPPIAASLVAQIVCCAGHRTAFSSQRLPWKASCFAFTCCSTNQLNAPGCSSPQCVHSDRQHHLCEPQPATSSAAPTIPALFYVHKLFLIINELDATRVVRRNESYTRKMTKEKTPDISARGFVYFCEVCRQYIMPPMPPMPPIPPAASGSRRCIVFRQVG